MSVADTSGSTKPQVTTLYSDYAPGDTAEITATGFEPGSTIEF